MQVFHLFLVGIMPGLCWADDDKPCNKTKDIGIILDASCTESGAFEQILKFLSGVVGGFEVSSRGTHFGVVTYREQPKIQSTFEDCRRLNSAENLKNLIKGLKCENNGERRTDKALKMAGEFLFTSGTGMRNSVPRILLLVTDGNTGKHSDSYHNVIQPLRNAGIIIISVGVGNHIGLLELVTINGGTTENAFLVDDVDKIADRLKEIGNTLCKAEKPKKPECDLSLLLGTSAQNAPLSCKDLKNRNPSAPSGVYYINAFGTGAFQAYCDQETEGGGWTLVWSYTFTDYNHFRAGSNAVTPSPNWPANADVPVSTTVPLAEDHFAALGFNKWRRLGSEILIKSNINHWITCTPGSGNLLEWMTGSINCHVVRSIGGRCANVAPDYVMYQTNVGQSLGPDLIKSGSWSVLKEYYFFEVSLSTANWPTHDPCGANGVNHVKEVSNPHGNVFVRAA